jgi:hypothetical protein
LASVPLEESVHALAQVFALKAVLPDETAQVPQLVALFPLEEPLHASIHVTLESKA